MLEGSQADGDGGFKNFMGIHNLNFNFHICDASRFKQSSETGQSLGSVPPQIMIGIEQRCEGMVTGLKKESRIHTNTDFFKVYFPIRILQ